MRAYPVEMLEKDKEIEVPDPRVKKERIVWLYYQRKQNQK